MCIKDSQIKVSENVLASRGPESLRQIAAEPRGPDSIALTPLASSFSGTDNSLCPRISMNKSTGNWKVRDVRWREAWRERLSAECTSTKAPSILHSQKSVLYLGLN